MLTEQPIKPLKIYGRRVQSDMIGSLRDADINGDLEEQLARDGYLLLRGVHDPQAVHAARIEILQRLVEVGEIAEPAGKPSCQEDRMFVLYARFRDRELHGVGGSQRELGHVGSHEFRGLCRRIEQRTTSHSHCKCLGGRGGGKCEGVRPQWLRALLASGQRHLVDRGLRDK